MSGWKRIVILIGIVLSIAWIGVMFYRGSNHMLALRLAMPMRPRNPARERTRRTALRFGFGSTWRLHPLETRVR
jgi:hypothetical protein